MYWKAEKKEQQDEENATDLQQEKDLLLDKFPAHRNQDDDFRMLLEDTSTHLKVRVE